MAFHELTRRLPVVPGADRIGGQHRDAAAGGVRAFRPRFPEATERRKSRSGFLSPPSDGGGPVGTFLEGPKWILANARPALRRSPTAYPGPEGVAPRRTFAPPHFGTIRPEAITRSAGAHPAALTSPVQQVTGKSWPG